MTSEPHPLREGGAEHRSVEIILVEDNPIIRGSLIALLSDLEDVAVPEVFDDAHMAIQFLLGRRSWRVTILDLYLRRGNGLSVLGALTTRRFDQKVVVLSNYITPDIRARCEELGADAIFDKSNEIDALVAYCSGLRDGPAP